MTSETETSDRTFSRSVATDHPIGLLNKPGDTLLAASVPDILIRIDQVSGIIGLSAPTIYRLMAKGLFPRPVKITTTARAWKLSEIASWVESRERGDVS